MPASFSAFADELLKIAAEYAPGIPERGKVTPLPPVKKPETWKFSAHPHVGDVSKMHVDLRLGNPETGIAHSFVLPKTDELPGPGEARLVIPTNDHTVEYMSRHSFEIKKGYGKGQVLRGRMGDAEVYHSDPSDGAGTKIRFNLYDSDHPQEFSIRRDDSGRWFLHNKTQARASRPDLPSEKPKYRELDIGAVDPGDDRQAMMPKIDGAHTLVDLRAGRAPRLFSYRVGKISQTGLIEHTHKQPELLGAKVPKELDRTVLRAETVAEKGGRPLSAEQTGGILNAKVWESRKKQESLGARLRTFPFNVVQHRGKSMDDATWAEKLEVLEKVVRAVPGLKLPEIATGAGEKREMLEQIRGGRHPLTGEGVVLVDQASRPVQFTKAKVAPDFDVFIREVHPAVSGETGEEHDRAGSVSYSWTEDGPVVGQFGGFKHEEARDMLKNPGRYVGRAAKVTAAKTFSGEAGSRGALFQPRFKEWHLDKNDP